MRHRSSHGLNLRFKATVTIVPRHFWSTTLVDHSMRTRPPCLVFPFPTLKIPLRNFSPRPCHWPNPMRKSKVCWMPVPVFPPMQPSCSDAFRLVAMAI